MRMKSLQQKKSVLNEADWQRLREEIKPALEEIVENTKPVWVDRLLSAADRAAGDYKKFEEERLYYPAKWKNLNPA